MMFTLAIIALFIYFLVGITYKSPDDKKREIYKEAEKEAENALHLYIKEIHLINSKLEHPKTTEFIDVDRVLEIVEEERRKKA